MSSLPPRSFDWRPDRTATDGRVTMKLPRLALLERTAKNLEAEPITRDLKQPGAGQFLVVEREITVDGQPYGLPEGVVASTGPLRVTHGGQPRVRLPGGAGYFGGAPDRPAWLYSWEAVETVRGEGELAVSQRVELSGGETTTVRFEGLLPPWRE